MKHIKEENPQILAEVETNNLIVRSIYGANPYGEIVKLSESKPIYSSVNRHVMKIGGHPYIPITLGIRDLSATGYVIFSEKQNFTLKKDRANIFAKMNISDSQTDTIVSDYFKLIEKSDNYLNIASLIIDDQTPTSRIPPTLKIVDSTTKANPTINMTLSDQHYKRFHIMTKTTVASMEAVLSVDDNLQPSEFQEEHTIRPLNSTPGTANNISMTISGNEVFETITVDNYHIILYNTSQSPTLYLNISDSKTDTIRETQHVMRYATDDSINLRLNVDAGNIQYNLGTVHTIKKDSQSNLTVTSDIYDWLIDSIT